MLRDNDDQVTILAQNIKFIATGGKKDQRAAMLASHLHTDPEVDLLLLSEARQIGPLREALAQWCVYAQAGPDSAYEWSLDNASPGGLVLAVRQRESGLERTIAAMAGRVFRSRPVTLAEGFLGRIAGFEKGWAVAGVDGTEFVWTHTQASYARFPARGAGSTGVGRAGQFDDLAFDLGRTERPTLVTGDLNLHDGTESLDPSVRGAAEIDVATLSRFSSLTGVHFPADRAPCSGGSFLGTIRAAAAEVFPGLVLDRVGTNPAFVAAHPETRTSCEHIKSGGLSVSDHLGVRIAAPFDSP